jgi:two-component sensor histidine kinase
MFSVADRLSLADRFGSDQAAIFRSYESRLKALGSALLDHPNVWAECQRLAESVVSNCRRSLSEGEVVLGTGYLPRATSLGSACLASGVDLREAVRAGTELYEAVSDALARAGVPYPALVDPQKVALAALSQSISGFIQAVWSWYDLAPVGQLAKVQLGNRQWLAREIHDWIGNCVSLAIRHLDLYEIYRERGQSAAEGRLVELRRTLDELLAGTRQLVSNLRSPWAEGGLGAALRSYVQAVSTHVVVDIVVRGDEALVPDHYRDELLAVTREAVRNALAHARPTTVVASLDITPKQVRIVVEDDGAGFDAETDPAARRGAGLASMRERTRLLGGELVITSRPADGTHVQIWIPLREHGHVDVG